MTTTLRLASDSSQARQDMQEFGRVAQQELAATQSNARGLNVEFGNLEGGLESVNRAAGDVASGLSKASLIAGLLGSKVTGPLIGAGAAALSVAAAFASINAETAQLGRNIEASGLSPELFQAIERRTVRSGVDLKEMGTALVTARQRFYEAERSAGAFYSQLRVAAPDVLEAINAQQTQTEKLEVFLKALEDYPNKMDRATLAQAAFGEQGLKIVRVLSSQEGGLAALQRQYAATGGIATAENIRTAQEIERAWVEAIRSIGSEWDQFVFRVKKGGLDVVDSVTTSAEERLEDDLVSAGQALAASDARIAALERDLAAARDPTNGRFGKSSGGRIIRASDAADIEAALAREKAAVEGLSEAYRNALTDLSTWRDANATSILFGPEDPESKLQNALQAAAERVALEAEAAQLLIQQNDITGAYEQGLQRLARLKAADLINAKQLGAAEVALADALARQTPGYQARMEAEREAAQRAEEYRRLQGEAAQVLVQQNDITLALRFETERVNRLKRAGLLTDTQAASELERAEAALIAMTPAFREAAEFEKMLADFSKFFADETARAADEAERLAQTQRDARNAAAEQVILGTETAGERRRREIAELEALAKAGREGLSDIVITPETEARRLAQIEEGFQRAVEEASRFRDTQYEIEDALWALSDPAGDFEAAWKRAARTFVEEFLGIEEMIRGFSRTLREMIEGLSGGNSLGDLVGGLFGLGAGKAVAGGAGASITVPEFHGGGLIGQPTKWRDLSKGVGPHESLVLARNDEVIGYPGSMGARSVSVSLYAPGADAEGLASLRQEVALLRSALIGAQTNFVPNVETALSAIAAQKGRLI